MRGVTAPITTLVDENGLTLIHHAVLKGVDGKVQILIDYAEQQQKVRKEEICRWVNVKTTEEFWTALHYASFSGNLDAIYVLLRYEADIRALNVNLLNMLHVAC